ncbi:hypothetical protein OERS_05060 [Oerskovia enterophila]|uniref:Uncharacterized protein n=1 Tax=Oerskovia enterophila TaxID=43678 RepID=A0ABX2Y8R3_9CELL|nr:hypothetical protein OERS_05060 [Oerskovia enterophila]
MFELVTSMWTSRACAQRRVLTSREYATAATPNASVVPIAASQSGHEPGWTRPTKSLMEASTATTYRPPTTRAPRQAQTGPPDPRALRPVRDSAERPIGQGQVEAGWQTGRRQEARRLRSLALPSPPRAGVRFVVRVVGSLFVVLFVSLSGGSLGLFVLAVTLRVTRRRLLSWSACGAARHHHPIRVVVCVGLAVFVWCGSLALRGRHPTLVVPALLLRWPEVPARCGTRSVRRCVTRHDKPPPHHLA